MLMVGLVDYRDFNLVLSVFLHLLASSVHSKDMCEFFLSFVG